MIAVPHLFQQVYIGRTIGFAYAFVVLSRLAVERGLGTSILVLLALQFLALPHVFHWQLRRAREPRAAGAWQLRLDALLFGVWIAVFGFPDWASLGLLFAAGLSAVVILGVPGLAVSMLLCALGALAWSAVAGFRHQPEVSATIMQLSLAGPALYGWLVGFLAFGSGQRLGAARRKVAESEHRYQLIAENVGDLVAMVDRGGRWLYTSPSFRNFLYEPQLGPERDCYSCILAGDRPALAAAIERAATLGSAFDLCVRLRAMDGTERLIELSAHSARCAEDGERVVLVGRDITEIREQKERLEVAAHAFDQMTEAIMIHKASGEVVMVNQAFCDLTGYSMARVIGHPESEFRNACQPARFYDEMYAAVEREGRWTGSTWSNRQDGSIYREWRNVSAIREEPGQIKFIVSIFFEIKSDNDMAGSGQRRS